MSSYFELRHYYRKYAIYLSKLFNSRYYLKYYFSSLFYRHNTVAV
jgi:hypothetical protein